MLYFSSQLLADNNTAPQFEQSDFHTSDLEEPQKSSSSRNSWNLEHAAELFPAAIMSAAGHRSR